MLIKLFYKPNLAEEVGHAFIRAKPIEPKDMYQERPKRKPNHNFYYRLLRNQNNPWYPLFGYSILRHGVTIRVGVNFKPKNPVEVLHFHKIQVWLNVSRICKPKIIERGIAEKT